jgi:hypothetical protein
MSSIGNIGVGQMPTGRPTWSHLRHPTASMSLLTAVTIIAVGASAGYKPLAGVAIIAGVVWGLIVIARPDIGGYVLVALVPAVSGLRPGLPVPGLRISEIIIVATALTVLATASHDGAPRWRRLDTAAIAYVVVSFGAGLFDQLHGDRPLGLTELATMIGPLEFFLIYRAVIHALPDERRRVTACRWLIVTSVPVSLLGIMQEARLPGVRPFVQSIIGKPDLASLYSYAQLNRATGPFPQWHMLAGYLLVIMLLAINLLMRGENKVIDKRWMILILLVDGVALAETVSITPVAGLVAGTLILAAMNRRLGKVTMYLALGAVVLGIAFAPTIAKRYDEQFKSTSTLAITAPPGLPETIGYRYQVWTQEYLPSLAGRWLVGYGPDLPPEAAQWPYTESMYLTLLLRGGVLLLAVWVALMAEFYGIAKRRIREHVRVAAARQPDDAPVGLALAQVLLTMVVLLYPMQMVMPYFVDSGLPQVFWALAGLVAAAGPATGAVFHRRHERVALRRVR